MNHLFQLIQNLVVSTIILTSLCVSAQDNSSLYSQINQSVRSIGTSYESNDLDEQTLPLGYKFISLVYNNKILRIRADFLKMPVEEKASIIDSRSSLGYVNKLTFSTGYTLDLSEDVAEMLLKNLTHQIIDRKITSAIKSEFGWPSAFRVLYRRPKAFLDTCRAIIDGNSE